MSAVRILLSYLFIIQYNFAVISLCFTSPTRLVLDLVTPIMFGELTKHWVALDEYSKLYLNPLCHFGGSTVCSLYVFHAKNTA